MNRNAVPVFKKKTGTPFRCVPVQFEPCGTHCLNACVVCALQTSRLLEIDHSVVLHLK